MYQQSNNAPTRPVKIKKEKSENSTPIHKPVLKVMGLGGGGSNAIDRMIEFGIEGVEFIVANTDRQALEQSLADKKVQLGPKLTRGLGAGGDPSVGYNAAKESWREISAALEGADMVFLTAGMGGGTGTGSIPVAAKIANEQGAVTISIVTTPFSFEMGRRQRNSQAGLDLLRKNSDTLITIPNDRLLYVIQEHIPLDTAFRYADNILRQAVQGISELITVPGLINVDFAHIQRLMSLGGGALMAIGHGKGEDKALHAVREALEHPLLESVSLESSAGIIANFTAGNDLSLIEVSDALQYLQDRANPNTEIVMGAIQNSHMEDRTQVILIVTGLGATPIESVLQGSERLNRSKHVNRRAVSHSLFDDRGIKPKSPQNLDLPAFLRR